MPCLSTISLGVCHRYGIDDDTVLVSLLPDSIPIVLDMEIGVIHKWRTSDSLFQFLADEGVHLEVIHLDVHRVVSRHLCRQFDVGGIVNRIIEDHYIAMLAYGCPVRVMHTTHHHRKVFIVPEDFTVTEIEQFSCRTVSLDDNCIRSPRSAVHGVFHRLIASDVVFVRILEVEIHMSHLRIDAIIAERFGHAVVKSLIAVIFPVEGMKDKNLGILGSSCIMAQAGRWQKPSRTQRKDEQQASYNAMQTEEELAAMSRLTLHSYRSFLIRHDGLADVETQACALVGLVHLDITLKERCLFLLGHTNACVLHIDLYLIRVFLHILPAQRDAALGRELEGIAEEVIDHLLGAGHVDV